MGTSNFFKILEECSEIYETRIRESEKCYGDLVEIGNELRFLVQIHYKNLIKDERATLFEEISAFFASYVFKQELSKRIWSAVEKIYPQILNTPEHPSICSVTLDFEIGDFSNRQLNRRIIKRIASSDVVLKRFAVVLIIDSIVKLDRLKRISEGITYSEKDQLAEHRKWTGFLGTAPSSLWSAVRELPILRCIIGSHESEVLRTDYSARREVARRLNTNAFFLPITSTNTPVGGIKEKICLFKQDWEYSNSNYNRFLDLYNLIELHHPQIFSLNQIAVNELVNAIYITPKNRKDGNLFTFNATDWDFIYNIDLRLAVNGLSRSVLSVSDFNSSIEGQKMSVEKLLSAARSEVRSSK